jgi:hypothetical protein
VLAFLNDRLAVRVLVNPAFVTALCAIHDGTIRVLVGRPPPAAAQEVQRRLAPRRRAREPRDRRAGDRVARVTA